MPTVNFLVAVPCELSPGMFPGERVVGVQLANGDTYQTFVPSDFCWNAAGQLVGENEPSTAAPGMVAAHLIDDRDDHQTAVEIPDGEVIAVKKSQVKPRPTPIVPPWSRPSNAVRTPE